MGQRWGCLMSMSQPGGCQAQSSPLSFTRVLFFLIIMSENKSFNQDHAAAQQENLNRNYQYFILCL